MMWRQNRFQAPRPGSCSSATQLRLHGHGHHLAAEPVPARLRVPVGADLAMSSYYFYGDNPSDLNKTANGGFVYAKAGARTVVFYDGWYEARRAYPGKNEQDVFDQVKARAVGTARHGVRVQFLDTAYLSGFCELRKDFHKVKAKLQAHPSVRQVEAV